MNNSIIAIMDKEHKRLLDLLLNIENDLNDIDNLKRSINNFKWNLEKHFFVEEKVIFKIYSNSIAEEIIDLNILIKEHRDIFWLLKKIENSIPKVKIEDLENMKNDLLHHTDFEIKVFYPRLEEELEDEEKALIKDRLDEFVG